MKFKNLMCLIGILFTSSSVFAEASMGDKIENTAHKTSDAIKKSVRNAEDKICETVNGKTECVLKKAKHSLQNTADEANTKANELKREAQHAIDSTKKK